MKVVVIAENGGSGGLKGAIKGFLSGIKQNQDVEITVICSSGFAEYIKKFIADNITVVVDDTSCTTLRDLVCGNKLSKATVSIIDRVKPDVIYYSGNIIHNGAEKYTTVVGMHNQLFIDKSQLFRQGFSKTLFSLLIQRYFAIKSLNRADGVIFDSNASLKRCQEAGIYVKNSQIAYFGVETEERLFDERDVSLHNPIDMLYVSTLFPYKNQIELLNGIYVLKNRGYKIRLHLVGSGPKRYTKKIQTRIKELSLNDEVILHSWVQHDEIKKMIDQTDIFVYASSIETSGFGLMEAMVRKAVIVCNDESAMPEILRDGGLLMDIQDPVSVADAIQKAIDNNDLRKKLSYNAFKSSQDYLWECHSKTVISFFKKLLKDSRNNEDCNY